MKKVIYCLGACFSSTVALMRTRKPLAIVLGAMVLVGSALQFRLLNVRRK